MCSAEVPAEAQKAQAQPLFTSASSSSSPAPCALVTLSRHPKMIAGLFAGYNKEWVWKAESGKNRDTVCFNLQEEAGWAGGGLKRMLRTVYSYSLFHPPHPFLAIQSAWNLHGQI